MKVKKYLCSLFVFAVACLTIFSASAAIVSEYYANEYSKQWTWAPQINGITYTTYLGGQFTFGGVSSGDNVITTCGNSNRPIKATWGGQNGTEKSTSWSYLSTSLKGTLWVGTSYRVHQFKIKQGDIEYIDGNKVTR